MYKQFRYLSTKDYEAQSQALYNVIDNIAVFPKDYDRARNCISSASSYRNGFEALYHKAAEVIPALNERQTD